MQSLSLENSQKIKNMSFLCAVLVVCIHMPHPTDWGNYLFEYWIQNGVAQIAVPFFFTTSGFLLMNHCDDEHWWLKAVRSRFHSLFIPIFILNILWFPIKYLCHYIGYKYFGADHSNPIMELTLKNFLISISPIPISGGPVISPLWYVRALFYLIALSPIFVWFIRKSKPIAIVITTTIWTLWLLQVTIGARYHLNGALEFSVRCSFYFSLGIALRLWGGGLQYRIQSAYFVSCSDCSYTR